MNDLENTFAGLLRADRVRLNCQTAPDWAYVEFGVDGAESHRCYGYEVAGNEIALLPSMQYF